MAWKIKGQLSSRIGNPVKYGVPKDIHQKGGIPSTGIIVDEIWAKPEINTSPPRQPISKDDWGDYSFCAQLIRWDNGSYEIRLAYYRRPAGEEWWKFASQTTVSSDWKTIKTLMEKTLAKTNWFSDSPKIE